jgi:hypothetical protein
MHGTSKRFVSTNFIAAMHAIIYLNSVSRVKTTNVNKQTIIRSNCAKTRRRFTSNDQRHCTYVDDRKISERKTILICGKNPDSLHGAVQK